MKSILALFSLIVLSSCATTGTYQKTTSGLIGCAPGEIQIADIDDSVMAGATNTWTATCKGKKHFCTGKGTNLALASCKEAQ